MTDEVWNAAVREAGNEIGRDAFKVAEEVVSARARITELESALRDLLDAPRGDLWNESERKLEREARAAAFKALMPD